MKKILLIIALLLVPCASCGATAWSYQQGAFFHASGAASPLAGAYAGSVNAGSQLVLAVLTNSTGLTGVSDSVNGAWTAIGTPQALGAGTSLGQLFYFKNSGAGTPTVTATWAGTQDCQFAIVEYRGGADGSLDTSTKNGGTGTNATTGNFTVANNASLVVSATFSGVGNATQSNSGYVTERSDVWNNYQTYFDNVNENAGTFNLTSTISGSTDWASCTAVFLSAAAGGTAGTKLTGPNRVVGPARIQ